MEQKPLEKTRQYPKGQEVGTKLLKNMAYAQWIEVKVVSEKMTLSVKNAKANPGKFHKHKDKDHEISVDDINKITVESMKSALVCSCGRENSWSGTEGSFDLYDGKTKIGNFQWDCPWGSKSNSFKWTQEASKEVYNTKCEDGNDDSGAIGEVTIICLKL